jgi:hypothetical protein
MMNVQAAYMACKDADFVRFAKDEYGKWEQGANMSLKQYMNSCLIKFKTLKMKGLWGTPSPEQEHIIALTAVFTSMKLKATNARSTTFWEPLVGGPVSGFGLSHSWLDVPSMAGHWSDPPSMVFLHFCYFPSLPSALIFLCP